jgi:NAD(P)-dependent dehydrogenase (short-subunit alcohol dehydrogenase family)
MLLNRFEPSLSVREQALELRAWTLRVLSQLCASATIPAISPPPCSLRAWQLFLAAEACALPLCNALAVLGWRLPASEHALLDAHACRELLPVLQAKVQCQAIGRMVTEHGLKAAVLKGARLALQGGDAVYVLDVDVLLPPRDAEQLFQALTAAGYRELKSGAAHRLPVLVGEAGIAIEIHTVIPCFASPGGPWEAATRSNVLGLWNLAPRNHLWHLLLHITVQHPERRGRIRDLYLVARALQDCSASDLDLASTRIQAHSHTEVLTATLAMARAIQHGHVAPDPFAHIAAVSYQYVLASNHWRALESHRLHRALFAQVAGRTPGSPLWLNRGIEMGPALSGPHYPGIGKWSPWISDVVRLIRINLFVWLLAPFTVPFTWMARRCVTRTRRRAAARA